MDRVVIQPDGKILVVGAPQSLDGFGIARYNSNGSPDGSFGSAGFVTTPFPGGFLATSLALQPDNRIVVAGFSSGAFDHDFAVARYNSNGSLDTGFSADGKVVTDLTGEDVPRAVGIEPGGDIVVAGSGGRAGGNTDFSLVRYHSDGSLDTTFSDDGIQTTDVGPGGEVRGLAVQPDGKILAAGAAGSSDHSADGVLVRYDGVSSTPPPSGAGGSGGSAPGQGAAALKSCKKSKKAAAAKKKHCKKKRKR